MPSAVRISLLVACGVFGMPLIADAQYKVESFEGITPATDSTRARNPRPPGMYPGGSFTRRGMRLPVPAARSRSAQGPQWTIPVGEFGLELADGTRMVGRPAKDWTARVATGFGTVTIPLVQIAQIAPAGKGQFAAYLTNGDRVSGSLVSNAMKFETKFGTLSVAAADIARLRSSHAAITPQPVAGGVGPPNRVRVAPSSPRRLRQRLRDMRMIEKLESLRLRKSP
jgi:hypothetical protein